VALFGLLAYLLMGLGGVEGMILCIEKDGHVTVEALQSGPCGSPFGPAIKNSHCSPCVDVLISAHGSGNIAVNTQRISQQTEALAHLTELFTLSVFDKNISYAISQKPLVEKSSTLVSLRSIILLI